LENYFNYFTEIEECFRRSRGTPTLLSPLDWALIESWKEAGLPVEAVLVGIERAFGKFQARPRKFQRVNSLAYCTQEVMRAAEEFTAGAQPAEPSSSPAPFSAEELRRFFDRNRQALAEAAKRAALSNERVLASDLEEAARAVEVTASRVAPALTNLREVEEELTAVEEKLSAALTRAASVEKLAELRREVGRGLASSRRRMTAAQIESLERQFLKKRLFEHFGVPRLSLFYL
jgi:hypothetical protein